MKKIYILIATILISGGAFAQSKITPKEIIGEPINFKVPFRAESFAKNIGDTAGWSLSGNYLPIYGDDFWIYRYTDGEPVFGVNSGDAFTDPTYGPIEVYYDEVAQGYKKNSTSFSSATIKEILIIGTKILNASDPNAKSVVKIYKISPNKAYKDPNATSPDAPGPDNTNILATQDLLLSNFSNTGFTSVILNSPVTTSDDFAVAVNYKDIRLKGDTVIIAADNHGDGGNLDYAFVQVELFVVNFGVSLYDWYPTTTFLQNGDMNLAIFAVFDQITAVNEYYNGMKLANYPNPAADFTTISYSLESASKNVRIEVIDNTGKAVFSSNEGFKPAGDYSIKLNMTDLSAGAYYYTLFTDNGRITKKIIRN
jgi:hypothetical protein